MDLMDYRRKIIANSPHLSSASGAIASFSDGADLPLKSLLVDIEPVQSGSGDPSPTNIRPISGWNAVNVKNGNTVIATISLGETVYGGTLNPLTGVLTVDKVALVIDGVNIKFNYVYKYGTLNRFGVQYPTGLAPKYTGSTSYCISDKLTPSYICTIAINTTRPEGYYGFPHTSAFFVSMPSSVISGENTSEANAWAETNRPTVCYELDTPYTIQLTPQQVRSLYGQNNIFADTGNVALEYWAHP